MDQASDDPRDAISEHFDRALELSDAERERWLAELRESQPRVASALEELFAVRERAGFADFLSGTAPRLAGIEQGTLIGRHIGPYQIEAEAGRGGMGSVWRARRVDGRYEGVVAIKLVHASWLGQGMEQRFRTEGQLLGRLAHRHIARLLDAGLLDDTQPYLVLEYVEGEPIDEYCRQRSLGIEARIGLFLDVLDAVAHAHSHLIVHRDLKPGNIFVTRDGAVKLLDFGIAKLLEGDGSPGAPTQASQVALTPQYAAPEQLTGEAVTTGTDIYALGLVLYVLLTGTGPYPSDSASRAQFIQAVLTEDPPRPSTVGTVATIPRRQLRGDLDNILGKALKKAPAERYRSVTEFADDLKRLLRHEPVQAHADTVGYRVSKFVRRHRGGVLSALLTALALIGTTVFAVWQMLEARARRDLADYESLRSSAHTELSEFLLGDSIGQAPHDAAVRRLERARDMIHQRFSDSPRLQANLFISLSGRYIDIGDTRGGAALIQEAEGIASRLDDPHLKADIACDRAQDAVDAGDLAAAHAQEDIARANLRRMDAAAASEETDCAMATANIAESEGEYPRAIATTQEAMRALEREGESRSSRYTSIAHEHARSLVLAGDYRAGWAAEQAVMSITRSVGRANTGAYFAMVNVGTTALINGGQPRKAAEAIATAEAEVHKSSPDAELPFYLEASRRLAESAAGAAAADKSLMDDAVTAEKQGVTYLAPLYRLGAIDAALVRGDLVAAQEYWQAVSPLETHTADAAGRRLAATVLIAHAALDLARQDTTAAGQRLEQATALIPEARRAADPDWRRLLIVRIQTEYALRQFPAAARDADAALARARRDAVDPESSAWIGEALVWQARVELAQGERAAARANAEQAIRHLEQNLAPSHPLIAAAHRMAAGST